MAKEYIGMANTTCRYSSAGTVHEKGELAPCTQYEVDKGYFDKATFKKGDFVSPAQAKSTANAKAKADAKQKSEAKAEEQAKTEATVKNEGETEAEAETEIEAEGETEVKKSTKSPQNKAMSATENKGKKA